MRDACGGFATRVQAPGEAVLDHGVEAHSKRSFKSMFWARLDLALGSGMPGIARATARGPALAAW
jgi:hypothetical protein